MTRGIVAASYAALGTLLVWSRFAALDRGYCCDEIRTVVEYVREGPHAILVGPYVPNNHELFSLAAWASSQLFGESETSLRIWSALPFVLGVMLVTAWLHVRLGRLSGIFFLLLATVSPLLVDISWQARGYGLAFFAMAALLVSALEAERSRRTWLVVVVCAAGTVGTLTLPHFAVAFAATAGVLLGVRQLRTATLIASSIAALTIAAWYAPHFDDIAANTGQEYGTPIRTAWFLTAPFDHILVPGMTMLDEVLVRSSFLSLVWTAALGALMASSPLLRSRMSALIVCSGPVASVLVFWLVGADLAPRFFSFLLVPLFAPLASGCAAILARVTERPPIVRSVLALATIGLAVVASASAVVSVPREAREAHAEAAALIDATVPSTTTVHARMPHSNDLAFHLGRRVNGLETLEALLAVCDEAVPVVYVDEPWQSEPFELSCLRRPGVRHEPLEQYARGGVIHVWFIPPAT